LQSILLHAPGELQLTGMPTPTLDKGDVLVKVKAALTCGTDLKAFLRGHPQIPMPGPFGHEFAGVVAAIGEGVYQFKPGDPVMCVHSAPCGECYWCLKDQGNLCPSVMETKVLGAYAEYVRVPAHIVRQNMFPKPDYLSYQEAALLEPLACVVYGLNQVPVSPGDAVLVIGTGAIGLLFLLLLKARRISRVIMAGRRSFRLNMARHMGAWQVIDVVEEDLAKQVHLLTRGVGADVVIECTGKLEVWEQSFHLCRRGGHVVLFGGTPKGTVIGLDTSRLHYDQITIHSPFHFNPVSVRQAWHLLANRKIRGRELITGQFSLAELGKAFSLLQAGEGIKYAIIP